MQKINLLVLTNCVLIVASILLIHTSITKSQDSVSTRGDYSDGNYSTINYDKLTQAQIEDWNSRKPLMLKQLENIYVDFLSNEWSSSLQTHMIIPSNYFINVTNTTEEVNVYYLMQLRYLNWDEYDKMAGEFHRLKTTIKEYGGVMAGIRRHELR